MSPLVALHGFTGSPRAFESLGLPVAWAPALCGHGADPDVSAARFSDEVARLRRGLAARFHQPVSLLGYSMGARLGLGLALESPQLFSRIMLLGVNPGLESENAQQERLGWEARWIDILEQDGLAVFEHRWSRLPLFDSQHSLPPRSQDAQRTLRMSHTAAGLAHAMNVLGLGSMPNHWPLLTAIRRPIHLVVGSLDEKFLGIAERMQRSNGQFVVHVLKGVGHNPLLEAPERVAQLMRSTPEEVAN